MPFLLSSSYKFNPSCNIFVEIGLFTSRNFEPVAAFSGHTDDFLLLNFSEYTQLIKILTANSAFFTLDASFLELAEYPTQYIGNLNLEFNIEQEILFIKDSTQKFCVTRSTWMQFNNYRDILAIKFNFLEKYSIYCRLLYSRFVNFIYSQQQNRTPGVSSADLLLYAPTNIIPEHKFIRVDGSQYDSLICQLCDAEIRLFCTNDIFRDSNELQNNESITLATYFTRI